MVDPDLKLERGAGGGGEVGGGRCFACPLGFSCFCGKWAGKWAGGDEEGQAPSPRSITA